MSDKMITINGAQVPEAELLAAGWTRAKRDYKGECRDKWGGQQTVNAFGGTTCMRIVLTGTGEYFTLSTNGANNINTPDDARGLSKLFAELANDMQEVLDND